MCLPPRSVKFREFPSGSLRIFILMKSGLAVGWRNATNSWQFMEIKHHNSLNSAVIYPLPPPTSELYFPTFPFKTGARRHLISSICLIAPTVWTLDIYSLIWGAAAMSLCILEMLRSSPHTAGMCLAVASCTVCCRRHRYSRNKPRSRGWATCGLLPQITPPEGTRIVFCPDLPCPRSVRPSEGRRSAVYCWPWAPVTFSQWQFHINVSIMTISPSWLSWLPHSDTFRCKYFLFCWGWPSDIDVLLKIQELNGLVPSFFFFFLALLTQVMVWI